MKKLLPHFAGVFFALFVIGVAGAVLFYSFNGLGLIFPGDLLGQVFGLMLFDVSMIVWFLVFVSKCKSTMQYVFAGLGFFVGLAGTLGLVGIEVGLSSGMLEAGSMQKPLTYIFIGVLIGHLVLIYGHHAAGPQISAEISLGVEKAKITDQAQKDAEKILTENIASLSAPIAQELVKQVMNDLNLRPASGQVIDLPVLTVEHVGKDSIAPQDGAQPNFLLSWLQNLGRGARKYESAVPSVNLNLRPVTPKQSPVPVDVEPEGGGDNEPKV